MTVFKDFDVKLPVMLCVNCAIFVLLAYLNDALAFASVYIYAAALFIVPPALFLSFWSMTACVVVCGFFVEIGLPVRAGITPVFFALAGAGVFYVREKFRGLEPVAVFTLCWITNAALFLAACVFLFPIGADGFGRYLMRVSVDFVCSSLAVFLLSNFILKVYRSVFYLFGLNLEIPENA